MVENIVGYLDFKIIDNFEFISLETIGKYIKERKKFSELSVEEQDALIDTALRNIYIISRNHTLKREYKRFKDKSSSHLSSDLI